MTITQAIEKLQAIKDKHGNVDVYFDCPQCGTSFAPTIAATVGVHLPAEKPKEKK